MDVETQRARAFELFAQADTLQYQAERRLEEWRRLSRGVRLWLPWNVLWRRPIVLAAAVKELSALASVQAEALLALAEALAAGDDEG